MNPMVIVKRYYQKPFRIEVESGFELIFYKIFSKILGLIYTFYNFVPIIISFLRFKELKRSVVENEKSAFVFANGPSLSDIDLGKVRKLVDSGFYDLIAVNSFLSKSANDIKPTFAVFADNLHFSGSEQSGQYFQDVDACEKNRINYFVPLQHVKGRGSLRVGYNAFCDIFSENTTNIFAPAGFYGLTALHALRLAKCLGYKKIYLCGFDNSYFKDFEIKDDGGMVIRHRHYYDDALGEFEVPCIYDRSSEFFFDGYRHFRYLEKITGGSDIFVNIAKKTYTNAMERSFELDVYKN